MLDPRIQLIVQTGLLLSLGGQLALGALHLGHKGVETLENVIL